MLLNCLGSINKNTILSLKIIYGCNGGHKSKHVLASGPNEIAVQNNALITYLL